MLKKQFLCLLTFFILLFLNTSFVAAEDIIIDENTVSGGAIEISQDDLDVEVEVQSTFSVKIPKNITLDGDTKTGTYTVMVKGDLATDKRLCIVPSDNFIMSQVNKGDITAQVHQEQIWWRFWDFEL